MAHEYGFASNQNEANTYSPARFMFIKAWAVLTIDTAEHRR